MDIKKIKNFLYYNWQKIAAVIFIIVFVFVTFRQCSQRVETDLGIMYVGEAVVSDTLPKLCSEIKNAAITSDADGDGKITLNSKSIVLPLSKEKMIEQQVPEQIQVEIISGENVIDCIQENIKRKDFLLKKYEEFLIQINKIRNKTIQNIQTEIKEQEQNFKELQ